MELKQWVCIGTALAAFCNADPVSADVLHLNDGQKIVGVITDNKTDSRRVTIRTTSGEMAIPRARISRMEDVSAGESYAQLGDEFLASGNFDQAVETYQTGLQVDPNNLDLQQKLQQARGGMANKRAETQTAMDARAQRTVDQAMKLAADGDFEEAYSLMRSVEPSDISPVHAQFNKSMADLYLMWGQYMFDHQNIGGAAEKFNEVLKIEPDNTRAKQLLIKTFEGDPTKLQQMAEYYSQSGNPDEQLKGAEAMYKLQQYEQALPIYMKYLNDADLNHRYNITQRAQYILDTLHQQYASRGDYRTALAYFTQYMQVKPDADPTPYSKYVYMIKRSETDMNDPQARLQLAMLAEQLGLIPTAKEEYRNVLALDGKSTGALAGLRRFAESDLSDAREFLGSAQYTLAAQKAQNVVTDYTMYPDLVAQANMIQAQARVEAEKIAQNTRQEARALAERGDNYYAQAMQYLAAYVSTEVDINKRIFSPRNEAAKYLGQAIFAWKTALQMDPSLGDPTTYNLNFKIRDASAKYAQIANRRPPALPPRIDRDENN